MNQIIWDFIKTNIKKLSMRKIDLIVSQNI